VGKDSKEGRVTTTMLKTMMVTPTMVKTMMVTTTMVMTTMVTTIGRKSR
jgi:hypothetical protein